MDTAAKSSVTQSPQEHLAAILDSHQPRHLLSVSENAVPLLEHWCADHDCDLTAVEEVDPLPELKKLGRFDMAVVADQLEYMNHHAAEELIGRLRNLHTESLVVVYQPQLAPERLRWSRTDFLGMGLRREADFHDEQGRQMLFYSYELASYNFVRTWNNPRFWANPEMWGKYWW
jgi:hypothetical protein